MSGGSIKCLQVVVAILCILQFILGVIFLIMGGVGLNKSGSGAETKSAAIFLLVVGGVIVVVALFGLCGAIIKHACLLISVTNATGRYFNDSMTKYKEDGASRNFIDSMQLSVG
ncbi:hypothetical protein HELRODRAFT_163644 [Helobdella robusta]|uniref:Tetraspanin n=1 Tax=Helobdella robusta TaxID=6412 RepID=T1EUB1_HELRO|nr:hypothetical protein HELRODRAFT_163644 [Helobdella robusta]ESN96567.1 hypothetical protein HELRODRAFT_163644 [Helobdella robusta]